MTDRDERDSFPRTLPEGAVDHRDDDGDSATLRNRLRRYDIARIGGARPNNVDAEERQHEPDEDSEI